MHTSTSDGNGRHAILPRVGLPAHLPVDCDKAGDASAFSGGHNCVRLLCWNPLRLAVRES